MKKRVNNRLVRLFIEESQYKRRILEKYLDSRFDRIKYRRKEVVYKIYRRENDNGEEKSQKKVAINIKKSCYLVA